MRWYWSTQDPGTQPLNVLTACRCPCRCVGPPAIAFSRAWRATPVWPSHNPHGSPSQTREWFSTKTGSPSWRCRPDLLSTSCTAASEPICDRFFCQCAAIAYISARDGSGTRGPSVASCLIRRETFHPCRWLPPVSRGRGPDLHSSPLSSRSTRGIRTEGHRQVADRRQRRGDVQALRFVLVPQPRRRMGATLARGNRPSLRSPRHRDPGREPLRRRRLDRCRSSLAFFVARAGKSAYRKRKSFDFQTLAPQRILGAAGILVVVDLATLVGFTRWITARGPR